MTREELLSYCQRGQMHKYTLEEHQFGCAFFREDADGDAKYIPQFYFFYVQTNMAQNASQDGASTGTHLSHDLHNICLHYVANLEQTNRTKGEEPAKIYALMAEYYLELNVYAESFRNMLKALDSEPESVDMIGLINSMIISAMWESNMRKECRPYLDKLEELHAAGGMHPLRDYNIMVILMLAYSYFGEIEKMNRVVAWLEEHKNDQGLEITVFFYELYSLSIDASMADPADPKPEYLDRFRKILESRAYIAQTSDAYAGICCPIFRHIRPLIDEDEMERMVFVLADAVRSVSDRLDLFEMLTDEFGYTKEKHPKLYEAYFRELKDYYARDKHNRSRIIRSEQRSRELGLIYKREMLRDDTTGIANRHAYEESLAGLRKCEDLPDKLCVGMLDMNGLKEANDILGHDVGDKCLNYAAKSMLKAFEGYGEVFRIGGDEFAMIIYNDDGGTDTRMASVVRSMKKFSGEIGCEVSLSYGFAHMDEFSEDDRASDKGDPDSDCLHKMIKLADRRMYACKDEYYAESGRDRRRR